MFRHDTTAKCIATVHHISIEPETTQRHQQKYFQNPANMCGGICDMVMDGGADRSAAGNHAPVSPLER